jgi:hypothetical protein
MGIFGKKKKKVIDFGDIFAKMNEPVEPSADPIDDIPDFSIPPLSESGRIYDVIFGQSVAANKKIRGGGGGGGHTGTVSSGWSVDLDQHHQSNSKHEKLASAICEIAKKLRNGTYDAMAIPEAKIHADLLKILEGVADGTLLTEVLGEVQAQPIPEAFADEWLSDDELESRLEDMLK